MDNKDLETTEKVNIDEFPQVTPQAFEEARKRGTEERAEWLITRSNLDGYFNNWRLKLPDGRTKSGDSFHAETAQTIGTWNQVYREFLKDSAPKLIEHHSEKRLNSTEEEFRNDIIQVLKVHGLILDEIRKLNRHKSAFDLTT